MMSDHDRSAGAGYEVDGEEEIISGLKDFSARALKGGLKLFSLLDHPTDDNAQETVADNLKAVMGYLLEYDPNDYGDPSDLIESDPLRDGTADLLSVAQTAEALIGLREELPLYELPPERKQEFLNRINELIRKATGLIGVYFLDDSLRTFYDSLGSFDREADSIAMDIVNALSRTVHHG